MALGISILESLLSNREEADDALLAVREIQDLFWHQREITNKKVGEIFDKYNIRRFPDES